MLQPLTVPPLIYMLLVLGLTIYYIFPAYVANAIPVLAGGGTPIDLERNFTDGRRLFGEGKTYRGFIAGVIMAWVTATTQYLINPCFLLTVQDTVVLLPDEHILFQTSGLLGILMGSGALLGDLVGSFIKRRLNLSRGAPAPGIDQLDFLTGTILATFWLHPITGFQLLLIFIVTPLIHVLTNAIGYLLKVKKEPW